MDRRSARARPRWGWSWRRRRRPRRRKRVEGGSRRRRMLHGPRRRGLRRRGLRRRLDSVRRSSRHCSETEARRAWARSADRLIVKPAARVSLQHVVDAHRPSVFGSRSLTGAGVRTRSFAKAVETLTALFATSAASPFLPASSAQSRSRLAASSRCMRSRGRIPAASSNRASPAATAASAASMSSASTDADRRWLLLSHSYYASATSSGSLWPNQDRLPGATLLAFAYSHVLPNPNGSLAE